MKENIDSAVGDKVNEIVIEDPICQASKHFLSTCYVPDILLNVFLLLILTTH